jgi:hypothetical protein
MYDELRQLVYHKLKPRGGDRFAFLGDYVDKGPESLRTLRAVRVIVEDWPGSIAICGNHEESAMRLYAKAQKQGSWDGLRKVEKEPWLKDMTEDDYQWLRSLPLVARPLPGTVMVHGGMFPAYFDKHGEIGDVPASWHKKGGKRMDRMRRFLRVRHVYKPGTLSAKGKDIGGNMVTMGDEGDDTLNWANWYDGREGFAFYGHAPQKSGNPVLHNYALGLDTGAVFGGRLTAAVLSEDDQGTGTRFACSIGHVQLVSVAASRAYATWLEAFEKE